MQFKMNCFVLLCSIFIFVQSTIALDNGISEFENNVTSRRECWAKGGIISNIWRNSAALSALKMVKVDGEFTVFNLGKQIDFPKIISDEGGPNWTPTRVNESVVCETVLHYGCLQDIVINTTDSLDEFNRFDCAELHGNLIITGFSRGRFATEKQPDFSKLKEITKIGRRLIIESVQLDQSLSFDKLEQVGRHEENKEFPSIRIVSNSMQSIHFPLLDTAECSSKPPINCVLTANNHNYSSPGKSMEIKFRNDTLESIWISYVNLDSDAEATKEAELEKEKMDVQQKMKDYKNDYIDWQEEAFGEEASLVMGIIGIILFVAFPGFSAFMLVRGRRKPDYNFKEMEKADEKTQEEKKPEVSKMAENKSSHNDDLGSN
ncbi:hypothetical protein GCK72_014762 [Caenorhabditis remanei]|uniref:Receptor L-domain domain-containing protein n=1 Tax=Caenorhabditis remanei TaxID=31234 RepID=A0A6A5GUG9_CAERE|nr:hypothetical protein GCK72_014762 [Caenorhabditis remanei]KAF1758304.1 hypothetical protein GCK72_014762 [Caenorhabditis remanei]